MDEMLEIASNFLQIIHPQETFDLPVLAFIKYTLALYHISETILSHSIVFQFQGFKRIILSPDKMADFKVFFVCFCALFIGYQAAEEPACAPKVKAHLQNVVDERIAHVSNF